MARRIVPCSLLSLALVAGPALAAPDPDMELRCKEIDARGGENACLCSEPMIADDGWSFSVGWNDLPGSTSKPCGDESPGKPLYIAEEQVAIGPVAPAGPSAVPRVADPVPYVFLQQPPVDSSAPNTLRGVSPTLPEDASGRLCHRFMVRYSADWVSKTGTGPGRCQADKLIEYLAAGMPPQYQGVMYPGGWDIYYSGGPDQHLGPRGITLRDCQGSWCGFEQCLEGNFASGDVRPIARAWVIDAAGRVGRQDIARWSGGPLRQRPAVPVRIVTDWIANLYKQGRCGGRRWLAYAMEAWFETGNEGPPGYGPWIGPPAEMLSATTQDAASEGRP